MTKNIAPKIARMEKRSAASPKLRTAMTRSATFIHKFYHLCWVTMRVHAAIKNTIPPNSAPTENRANAKPKQTILQKVFVDIMPGLYHTYDKMQPRYA